MIWERNGNHKKMEDKAGGRRTIIRQGNKALLCRGEKCHDLKKVTSDKMTFILLNWHLKLKIFSTSVRQKIKRSPNFASAVPEGVWSVVVSSVCFPSTIMIPPRVFVVETQTRWINPDIMVTVSSSFDIIWANQSSACPFTARKMQDWGRNRF